MANFLKSLFVKGVEIDTAGAITGDVLKYNGSKFGAASAGGGSAVGVLNDLTDVVITSVATDQLLVYNGTNWVNTTGPVGPAGATGATGATGINFLGAYNPSTEYFLRDVVTYAGSSWYMSSPNPGSTGYTPGSSFRWTLFTSAGADGAAGANGDTGPQGPEGPQGPSGVMAVSDTAPGSPSSGNLWYKSNTGAMYVYYDSFWVEVGSPSSGLDGGSA